MLRILEVINSLRTVGGAETFAVDFVLALSKVSTVDVVILYDQNDETLMKRLLDKGITVHVFHKKGHIDLKAIKQLRALMREGDYDVIHTENNALITSFFAARPLKKRPRIYHTVHNPANIESGGKLSQFLYKRFFKTPYAVPVGISSSMADSCNAFYKLTNTPYVDNGIDLSSFDSSLPLGKRPIDIAVVARMTEQKNYPFLIQVFSKLVVKYPSLRVSVAGDGILHDQVVDLINQNHLENNVTLLGVLPRSDSLLKQSKVLVLGSHYEGNPLCVLEAMASGCVVVSTSVGGIPDIVKDGENGFLFDEGDLDGFAAKLSDILGNPSDYEGIRARNVKDAARFDISHTAQAYLDLFALDWRRVDA